MNGSMALTRISAAAQHMDTSHIVMSSSSTIWGKKKDHPKVWPGRREGGQIKCKKKLDKG